MHGQQSVKTYKTVKRSLLFNEIIRSYNKTVLYSYQLMYV